MPYDRDVESRQTETEPLYTLLYDLNVPVDTRPLWCPWGSGWFLLLAGFYPLGVVLFEWAAKFCAGHLMDPLPTPFHLVGALLSPLLAIALFVDARLEQRLSLPAVAVGLGVCGGVAAFYTVLFAPVMPMALIGLLVGVGLLPFAPVLSLAATLVVARRLYRNAGLGGRFLAAGLAAGFLWMALAERHALRAWDSIATLANGTARERSGLLWFYRLPAMDSAIRRACDGILPPYFAPNSIYEGPNTKDACTALFLIHGRAPVEEQPVRLASSRMETTVDVRSATQYQEWTMEFHNTSLDAQEAMARLVLPRGGVVSRVTLWMNGEPREAAFGGAKAVTKAYESVVATKRDPLLVTWRGEDTVEFRCFPVPAAGRMRIRLGITAPLKVLGNGRARTSMPVLVGANFNASGLVVEADREVPFAPDPDVVRVRDSGVRRVTVVVDGSAGMAVHADALERVVRAAGARVVLATQNEVGYAEPESLALAGFAGGVDNRLALHYAKKTAGSGGVVVWVHEYHPFGARTDGVVEVQRDWERALDALIGARRYEVEWRERAAETRYAAQLWAAREVARLTQRGERDEALALAKRYRVVTAVSGAVVLESKEQYRQFGLEAPGAAVQTPEPATWMLMLVGLGGVLLWRRLIGSIRRFEGTR